MEQQVVRGAEECGVELGHGPCEALIRAAQPIKAGEVVFYISGRIVTKRTQHTIQLDATRHVVADADDLWQFMNHGCEPNVSIDVTRRQMVAIRDIALGEELTFNYNTTEWDMISPFDCACGAESCVGRIRGFRYLSPSQRAALRPVLSPLNESRFNRRP